jgi:hypothetical protein
MQVKRSNANRWRITVTPSKTGVCVSTVSSIGDTLAEKLSQVVEQAILEAARSER